MRRESVFHKCRFIPPHQSLTRQLPPKGKPLHPLHFSQQDGRVEIRKLGCFCNSACFLSFLFASRNCIHHVRTAYRRLPLGGKLSRKRLMRGDKSALMKGTLPTRPTHESSAIAALFTAPHHPIHQKLPCTATAAQRTRKIPSFQTGGCRAGKFGEMREVWRGKRPIRKGSLPLPRSSLYFPRAALSPAESGRESHLSPDA